METLRLVLLFAHILGFAALIGGLLVQARLPEKTVNSAMRDGIGTAFLAGLLLVGVLEAGDDPVNHAKVAVKFAIGLVILVLVMANRRRSGSPRGCGRGSCSSRLPTSASPSSGRPCTSDPGSRRVVHLLQRVDRCGDALEPRLQLQGEVERVVA